MEVFNILKRIYTGKNALTRHLSLFSLVGVLVIVFLKYTASLGNMFVYNNFFISVPATNIELWCYLFVGILLFFYLIGYGFKFANQVFFSKETLLPDFTLAPFYVFMQYVPMFIIWNIYFLGMILFGWFVLSFFNLSILIYLYFAIILCLIPFCILIFVAYSKKLRFESRFFSTLTLFKVLDKTLGQMISHTLSCIFLAIAPILLVENLLISDSLEKLSALSFAVKLAMLCVDAYILVILLYVFYCGCVSIIQKKFPELVD